MLKQTGNLPKLNDKPAPAKTVLVIGAGMGGMASAIRLAVAGYRVTIFEKNERVGGKLNLLELDGYRWDTGPSLITMPFVYEELFKAAGKNLSDYLRLVPVEPVCRYFYPDGSQFDASANPERMTAELERFSPGDTTAYFRFMGYSRRLYDLTAGAFLFNGFNHWRDFLQFNPRDAARIDPFRTVHQAVKSYFKDPRLVQLFDRYTTYNGSSPYKAPATLNIIPHVELGLGGWYIEGGLYQLARAYHQLALNCGVEFKYGMSGTVTRLIAEGKRLTGLQTADGVIYPAEIVVANTDVSYTYRQLVNLVETGVEATGSSVVANSANFKSSVNPGKPTLEPSCSGFVLFLGVSQQYSQLAHHNIFFSQNYKTEFDQLFQQRLPPTDPTIYVCNTSLTNPEHAPPGKSNLFVLVNAPYLSANFDWEVPGAAQNYRNLIIRRLEEFGLHNLNQQIETEARLTPYDLAQRYNADYGAIYGVSSNNRFSAFLRPPNRSRRYKGLYFVGGSTHPGGGVPLVTLSAQIVAKLIQHDHASGRV